MDVLVRSERNVRIFGYMFPWAAYVTMRRGAYFLLQVASQHADYLQKCVHRRKSRTKHFFATNSDAFCPTAHCELVAVNMMSGQYLAKEKRKRKETELKCMRIHISNMTSPVVAVWVLRNESNEPIQQNVSKNTSAEQLFGRRTPLSRRSCV